MSNTIASLAPEGIWRNFHQLTQIPRPSKKEARVIEYMKNFGESLGLETLVDEVGNIIIRKPATPGMEDRAGIVLQAHVDMVPQKNSDKVHDFENDPIETLIDGDWVRANGTTLGADNGMGVAAAMAVLEDKTLVHGPVEALFTIDEEAGMTGANNLQGNVLKGDILLNLDSEDEGELYIGCAGGINGSFEFDFTRKITEPQTTAYKMSVTGLKGGHSGMDIILGRGNSVKIITRLLLHGQKEHGLRLHKVEAGNMRNAIPREGWAIVTIPDGLKEEFENCFTKQTDVIRRELSVTEPDLRFDLEKVEMPEYLIDEDVQNNMLKAVQGCPNGVIRMSDTMEGLVETSNNVSILKSDESVIKILCLLRSSVDSAKDDLAATMGSIFELAGARVLFDGGYPGWKPNPDSSILKTMQSVYNDKWGKVPEIKAIHAGLECGILGAAYPNWDMISFGPTIRNPHSPDEKVNIPSVQKFWDFLTETLRNVPAKTVVG